MINGTYVIGVAGGVGAGKSTVLSYITARYRVETILADETGRELMEPGKSVYFALKEVYGDAVLNEEGRIDTAKLSSIVFSGPEEQKKVNGLEHPLIKSEIEWRIGRSKADVVFIEAALLIEGGLTEICDEVWLVTAKKDVRIARLMESRGYTKERCEQIIALQLSDDEMKKYAAVLIDNSGGTAAMRRAVDYHMDVLASDLKKDLNRY
ncbi:MAG: dephospho-CoA kinase [Lachnospiraceae bacterium]|nr:dephospho-CoA kinase [Lachnospiraceae bacterium]